MLIAFYNSLAGQPEIQQAEWTDLIELLATHKRTACDPCPGKNCSHKFGEAWSPVEFAPCPPTCRNHGRAKAYDCGGGQFHRLNDNVAAIHVAVFDIDHVTLDQVEGIASRVDEAGLAAILHSTHNHKPPSDCALRLLIPVSRPVKASEWHRFRAAAEKRLQLPADRQTKDLCRLYFMPTAPEKGPEPIASFSHGASLNVDAILGEAGKTPTGTRPVAPRTVESTEPAPSGGPVDFEPLYKRLRALRLAYGRSSKEGDERRHEALDRVLKGEVLAPNGARDGTLNQVCSILATSLPLDVPIDALIQILWPSVSKMDPPEVGTWFEEAADMIERARDRRQQRDDQRREWNRQVRERLSREARLASDDEEDEPDPEPEGLEQAIADVEAGTDEADPDASEDEETTSDLPGGYSETQLVLWAVDQGVITEEEIDLPIEEVLERFERRWIIQNKRAFWVFVNGKYQAPISKDDLAVSLPRDLARAPVTTVITDKEGNDTALSAAGILSRYATVARDVQASLALQRSYYDARTQTFFEAVRPLRNIKPRNHPEIHLWLTLLGGTESERLLDWVASVMRLDRQACALMIRGIKGVGKGLLASGLARLWTPGGPSELGRVLEGFNDVLVNCPLLFADESLPQRRGITAELRRLIGSSSRNLNRKFLPICNLDGAIRLIIAANNDRIFDTGEELSADDLAAVAQRFLYIHAPNSAAEYLESLGGPPVTTVWVNENKIAEHALYLRETRKVNESSRFLVEGEAREFHEHLATGSGMTSAVVEWIVKYLVDPTTKNSSKNLVLVGEGEILVNTEAMVGEVQWKSRVPSANVPSATKIGRALSNLSTAQFRIKVGDFQRVFHQIKPSMLLGWAERHQVGDLDYMRARVAAPNADIARFKSTR
jgi:hypothetical protein